MSDDPRRVGDGLGAQLGPYIDGVAAPITLDETRGGALDVDREPAPLGRVDRWRTVIAIAAALVLLGGLVALVRAPRDEQIAAGPGTTAAPAEDLSWLTPLGVEVPAPAVPAGWKVLDFQDMRFAVPSEWSTPLSRSCANLAGATPPPGSVFVSGGTSGTDCGNGEVFLPASTLDIDHETAPLTGGTPATIGTWRATFVPKACPGCAVSYHLGNGYEVRASGPEADQVLATFTDAGRSRALQSGPVASYAGWQTVTRGGIAIDVPGPWATIDLVASFTQTTAADGSVVQTSGRTDPGACTGAMFPRRSAASAYLGSMPWTPSCPAPAVKDLEPGDGIWLRDEPQGAVARSTIAHGVRKEVTIDVLQLDPEHDRSAASVELLIHAGGSTQRLSIGVGLDPSIARGILRSIRPAGAPLSAPTPAGSTGTSPSAASTPYCAAAREYQRNLAEEFGGGSQPGMSAEAARAEDRARLEAIARLAPPEAAADWSTYAAIGWGPGTPPDLLPRISAGLERTCGIVASPSPPGTAAPPPDPTSPTTNSTAFCAAARSYYSAAATPLDGSRGTAGTTPSRDVAALAREVADAAPPDVVTDWRRLAALEGNDAPTAAKGSLRQRLNVAFVQRCP